MSDFHKQLKIALDIRKMSQAELCEKTGIPKSAMSQYLSGAFQPKQKRTFLIAKALNVSEAWLMGFDGAKMERPRANEMSDNIILTPHERKVIIAYRKNPSRQESVDVLLGLELEVKESKKQA